MKEETRLDIKQMIANLVSDAIDLRTDFDDNNMEQAYEGISEIKDAAYKLENLIGNLEY